MNPPLSTVNLEKKFTTVPVRGIKFFPGVTFWRTLYIMTFRMLCFLFLFNFS